MTPQSVAGPMKRSSLTAYLATLIGLGIPSSALAHGEGPVLAIFGGAALAQFAELAVIGFIAILRLGASGLVVIICFVLADALVWGFVFRPYGFFAISAALRDWLGFSPSAADTLFYLMFWPLMLLAGPAASAAAFFSLRKIIGRCEDSTPVQSPTSE